jgi:hypothetical protein
MGAALLDSRRDAEIAPKNVRDRLARPAEVEALPQAGAATPRQMTLSSVSG